MCVCVCCHHHDYFVSLFKRCSAAGSMGVSRGLYVSLLICACVMYVCWDGVLP